MFTQIIGDDVIKAEINKDKDQTDDPSKCASFEKLILKTSTDDSKEDNFEEMPTRSERNIKDADEKEDTSKKNKEKRESKEKDRSRSKSRSDSKSDRIRSKESKSKDNKDTHDSTWSPEETRRSSPHKAEDNKETPKHETSTVYLSSESSKESPKNLKKTASISLEVPSPKRRRPLPICKSSVGTASAGTSACTSTTPLRAETHYVLFTKSSNDAVRSLLEKLGAEIVTDVMSCTVLVTLQVKRTFKLLCAVGLGRPVVGVEWLQACADNNTIVDPWLYLIKDLPAEERFNFNMDKTLRGGRNFLKGYNVSSTPSVLPPAEEMKMIVECSGGTWKPEGPNWICVTSEADRALWSGLRERGATLVPAECIVGGVLRQHADVSGTAFGFGVPASEENKATKKSGASSREFICTTCGRRCLSRIGLLSHARSHTKI